MSHINELRRFQAIITTKIKNKFGRTDPNLETKDEEWGWFIDPEINYYKPYYVKHILIPITIQEEKSIIRSTEYIRSIKSTHFNNEIVFNEATVATIATSYYVNIVKLITLCSLVYILIVL